MRILETVTKEIDIIRFEKVDHVRVDVADEISAIVDEVVAQHQRDLKLQKLLLLIQNRWSFCNFLEAFSSNKVDVFVLVVQALENNLNQLLNSSKLY